MNKRSRNKVNKRCKVTKKILKLVAKYNGVHNTIDIDRVSGSHTYIYNEETNEVKMVSTMTNKTRRQYEQLCEQLFILTEKLTSSENEAEWDNGYDKHYNYRIVKNTIGEYNSSNNTWVKQTVDYSGDNYKGTICLKIAKQKYLAFDYEC